MLLPSVEGHQGGNWIVIDSGRVIVHALEEKARSYYNLESLWTTEASTRVPNQSFFVDMPRGKGRIGPYRGERSCGMHTNPTNEENLTNPVNAIQLNNIATEAPDIANASCDIANNDPNHTISTPTISQASNDPFDATANGGRLRIVVVNGLLEPSSKCSRVITKVFKQKKHCVWDSSMEAQVKMAWVVKASQRYSDFLRDIRNSEKKPEYMSDDVWRQWKASWDKPEFKMKREKNSNNRRSIAGPSSHTGGSVSNVEHGKRLASSLGRMPTPHELFLFTHTKKHDGQTFIDEKSKSLNDKVLSLREAPQAIFGSRNDNSQPIDEVALYYEAVGGEKKRRVYGLGSQASYYCGGNTNASKSSASSFETLNQEEIQNELATMKKKIEAQDNLIVDLKRTIEMLCNHIGMPPLHLTQNASNNQSEECEGTRNRDGDGDGGEDLGLL